MAALEIPGQPKRWGNESTNFYQASYTLSPGVASRDKFYRCSGNQYANSGHFHVGTKAMNLNPPLDKFGTASAGKLKSEDQRLPKALTSSGIQEKKLTQDKTVNLYQSHDQTFTGYAMAKPPVKRLTSEYVTGSEALARSLNNAFYITSYQSEIAKYAATGYRRRSLSEDSAVSAGGSASSLGGSAISVGGGVGATGSLCENFEMRRSNTPRLASQQRRKRITSAPPIRTVTTVQPSPSNYQGSASPSPLQRRRSFTALQQNFPSKAEMIRDIFTVYPAPQPQPASKLRNRPSSAVVLRAGKIPNLRKSNPWV